MHVKEVQLKFMKQKISMIYISSLTQYHFPLGTKTDFLQRIIMGSDVIDIFSPLRSHLEYLAQFFNVIIITGYFHVRSNAKSL